MDEAEISLSDVLNALKKRWLFIVLPTLVISALTAVYARHLPKEYESTAMIRLGFVGSDPIESVAAASVVMKSEQLREQIAEKIGRANDEDYVAGLTDAIDYTDAAGLLQITVKNKDPQIALNLVNAVSTIIMERQKTTFEIEKKNLAQLIAYVKENIRPMPLSSGIREFRLSESELAVPANLPKKPVQNKKHFTSVAFALSLILFGFIALFLERKTIVKQVGC
jgi:uncharacterized protein involved in exopolysaccharide biosynthesis